MRLISTRGQAEEVIVLYRSRSVALQKTAACTSRCTSRSSPPPSSHRLRGEHFRLSPSTSRAIYLEGEIPDHGPQHDHRAFAHVPRTAALSCGRSRASLSSSMVRHLRSRISGHSSWRTRWPGSGAMQTQRASFWWPRPAIPAAPSHMHSMASKECMSSSSILPGASAAVQELQLTTLRGNVTALEISGTFDDCQTTGEGGVCGSRSCVDGCTSHLPTPSTSRGSSRSRSIMSVHGRNGHDRHPARGLLRAERESRQPHRRDDRHEDGSACAQVHRGGQCQHDTPALPRYRQSTNRRLPIPTISNAMDVGDPSNLARLRALFGDRLEDIRAACSSWSFSDDETRDAIRDVHHEVFIYPRSSRGRRVLRTCNGCARPIRRSTTGIVLETAHPAKFLDALDEELRPSVVIPARLQAALEGEKRSVPLSPVLSDFRDFLLQSTF